MAAAYNLHFYFDPVCPFAWMTSKWVRMVAQQRDYQVDWRFISLRILNAHIDYDAHFPPEYEAGHTAGLRLLRVAARARAEHGRAAVGPLYEATGTRIFDTSREVDPLSGADQGARHVLEPLLSNAGLPDRARRRAGRHLVGRRDPCRDRGSACPYGPRRRHPDPALSAAGRHRVLRPGDQQAAQPRGRWPAVGPRDRPRRIRRFCRAQAQPAGTAAACQLRRRHRISWQARGLARR